MKEFSVVITKNVESFQTITVVAKDEDEAGVKLSALVQDLAKNDNPETEGIKDFHQDFFEVDDTRYDWDDLECMVNCDEEEEDDDPEGEDD